jgi:hypothetical protein
MKRLLVRRNEAFVKGAGSQPKRRRAMGRQAHLFKKCRKVFSDEEAEEIGKEIQAMKKELYR